MTRPTAARLVENPRRELISREDNFKAKALRLYFTERNQGGGLASMGKQLLKVSKAKNYEVRSSNRHGARGCLRRRSNCSLTKPPRSPCRRRSSLWSSRKS